MVEKTVDELIIDLKNEDSFVRGAAASALIITCKEYDEKIANAILDAGIKFKDKKMMEYYIDYQKENQKYKA